jgi:hypothetical protein
MISGICLKGKETSLLSSALSLQDVFSESLNATGNSLKTFCPHGGEAGLSDIGQGNGRNLKGKKNQNQSEIFLEAAENHSKIRIELQSSYEKQRIIIL